MHYARRRVPRFAQHPDGAQKELGAWLLNDVGTLHEVATWVDGRRYTWTEIFARCTGSQTPLPISIAGQRYKGRPGCSSALDRFERSPPMTCTKNQSTYRESFFKGGYLWGPCYELPVPQEAPRHDVAVAPTSDASWSRPPAFTAGRNGVDRQG